MKHIYDLILDEENIVVVSLLGDEQHRMFIQAHVDNLWRGAQVVIFEVGLLDLQAFANGQMTIKWIMYTHDKVKLINIQDNRIMSMEDVSPREVDTKGFWFTERVIRLTLLQPMSHH